MTLNINPVFKILSSGFLLVFLAGCPSGGGGGRSDSVTVAVNCVCNTADDSKEQSSLSSIRGEGNSKEEAVKDAEAACDKYFPDHSATAVEDCRPHDPSLGTL